MVGSLKKKNVQKGWCLRERKWRTLRASGQNGQCKLGRKGRAASRPMGGEKD